MTQSGISVDVIGAGELRELARAIRTSSDPRRLRRELSQGMRQAARPLVPRVKAAAAGLPSQGQNARRGKPSTRKQLARSVAMSVRTSGRKAGVSVFMNPRRMPDKKKALPQYFERTPGKTVLKHPVFAARGTPPIVIQRTPPAGYFTRSIAGADRAAVREAQQVIDRIAREIESG